MEHREDAVRTWLRRTGALLFVLAAGWSAGDGSTGQIVVAASGPATIEQQGHPAGGTFDADAERRRQSEAHAQLVAERPEGVDANAITVEVTKEELSELGVSEPGTRKLRVGTVKPLNARVRFDDLQPSQLRGRIVRDRGVIQGTADGGFVWTAAIKSEGAAALRLRIDAFFLPRNSELWIYTAAGEAYGPYTSAGPHGTREFWTDSVSGAEAFLQLRKRGRVTPRDLKALGFVIADVAHIDPAALRGASGPDASPAAGFCSFNASCVVSGECQDSSWDNVRNAVAHIRFVSSAFVYICSGGLVADTDGTTTIPYFITANHCISRSGEASSMEAYFRFRSSSCNTITGCNGPGTSPKTSGSTIVSTNRTSDYTLLRLSQNAPTGSYFLGWTSTPVANTNNTPLYRFSHPKGAPQAYSEHVVDTSKVTCTSWPRGAWIYSRDLVGSTEGGSSGSPVVNSSSQLVGQLSGGCGFNVNDVCDDAANATVDGAFANYYSSVAQYLNPTPTSNTPPTAAFTASCIGLTCDFASSSSDPDGNIATYAWTFGDGTTSTVGPSVTKTYATANTYTVGLTVTDDDGATGTTSQSVTVSATPPPGITLSARGYKVKGLQKVDLAWSGATTSNVDIFRSNTKIVTANDGFHTDNINAKGGGSYTYRVCNAGTSTCSPNVTVTF